jgi:acyl-CoA reductase-like NAD-dependent aldehyde dehydrogenase
MSDEAVRLLEQLMSLPPEDRRGVVERLSAAVDADDAWADPEHRAEIARRLAHADRHPEELLAAEQVVAELRGRYRPGGAP